MSSLLEDQVFQLQKKLSQAKAYRIIAEFINNSVSSNKKLLKLIGDEECLLNVIRDLSSFSNIKAEELETGKYVEPLTISSEDVILVKQILSAFKNKQIK